MSTPPTPPAPARPARIRRRPLKTQEDIRKALAAVCADLEAGRMMPGQGKAIIYGLSVLSQVHDRSELEARLAVLEERLAEVEPKP